MVKKAKILAVDDEPLNLDIMSRYLEKEGFEVIAANDGDEALEKLKAHPDTDVILLDRMMPRMDGMEVLAQIKKTPELKDIPVIMQTAAAGSTEAFEGSIAGVYYYLTKPYEEFVLVALVKSALKDSLCMKEARLAETAMLESEELFRTLANSLPQLVWMADDQGRVSWCNRRWLDYSGMAMKDLEGCCWLKLLHPDHFQRSADKAKRCFDAGNIWEDAFPLRGRDGKYRRFLLHAIPIRDGQEKILHWFGSATDITDIPENSPSAHNAFKLTAREIEVLVWASRGKCRRDTAAILNISADTVKAHIEKARQKLDAANIAQAIAKAFIYGLIKP
ncbi:MAG: response regulator [Alphaproteobacteria bacterium]|nr:response regulator [Alphaproteobacteria bacterium]